MSRFLNLFRRAKVSREIAKELDFHISERTEQLIASGIPREHAERRARRQFGAYALHKEDAWMTNLIGWIESLAADVRYALRGFAKSPGFAAVAVLSLALGIGANTAIFTLLDAVLLRSLPVPHPEQLVAIDIGDNGAEVTNPIWEQLRDHQDVMQGVLAWSQRRVVLETGAEKRFVSAVLVSGSYFLTLGVGAALGRVLTSEDDRRGCAGVAMLSEGFWQKEYGGSSGVIGKTIRLSDQPFEIAGVVRAGFPGLDVGSAPSVFVPICTEPLFHPGGAPNNLDARSTWWLDVIGRLKPDVSLAQARARLNTLAPGIFEATQPTGLRAESLERYKRYRFAVRPAPSGFSDIRKYQDALWTLMLGVGLVLLIACANVANLLLARATARQHEMAVRTALGAGRLRLVRQTLTESLLLSLTGAALGLIFAGWASRALAAMISTTQSTVILDLSPDARVLAFTAGAAVITGVLFGLVPALRLSRVSPGAAMKSSSRGASSGVTRMRFSKGLIAVQVALSMILLAGAGLMLGTFRNLTTLNAGFRAEGVLLVNAGVNRNLPPDAQIRARLALLEKLRAIPGVRSASVSALTPISGVGWNGYAKVEGQPERPGREKLVFFNAASDAYFETLGTPLISGRDFSQRDTAASPLVMIVNASMAHRFFGNSNPLGRRIQVERDGQYGEAREIVGVVADAKYRNLRQDAPATAYLPVAQHTVVVLGSSYELRVSGPVASLIPAIKDTLSPGSDVPVQIRPFTQQISDSLVQERMLATLGAMFGALALALAALGLYGVLSYNVARRRNEIGIRVALGAARARVLAMVMGEASWLAFVGLGLGVAGALAASRLLGAFLYGMQADDPRNLAIAALSLAAVAAAAAYLPARRAASVDPMTALRDE